MQISDVSEGALKETAKQVLEFAGDLKVWLLEGEMGAGKTTFTKALAEVLGSKDVTSSPTFSLVNEYLDKDGKAWYHFDFYRIKDSQEAIDMGVYEYLDSGNLCLIEWPSKISPLLDMPCLEIAIKVNNNQTRTFLLKRHD